MHHLRYSENPDALGNQIDVILAAASQIRIQSAMMKIRKALLIAPLILATVFSPLGAQNRNYRNNRDNPNFYNGVRNGVRNGQYNDPRYDNRHYNDRNQNQGGIGPGKGALIGGAGGAVLGALFGGGLKGSLIGGAAGAGIGAIVGQVHQNNQKNQRRDNSYRRRR